MDRKYLSHTTGETAQNVQPRSVMPRTRKYCKICVRIALMRQSVVSLCVPYLLIWSCAFLDPVFIPMVLAAYKNL